MTTAMKSLTHSALFVLLATHHAQCLARAAHCRAVCMMTIMRVLMTAMICQANGDGIDLLRFQSILKRKVLCVHWQSLAHLQAFESFC